MKRNHKSKKFNNKVANMKAKITSRDDFCITFSTCWQCPQRGDCDDFLQKSKADFDRAFSQIESRHFAGLLASVRKSF